MSGPSAKPRATSLRREAVDRDEEYYVKRISNVSSPSSPIKVTWDVKFSSRIPVPGGRTSESTGGAVRSPEGNPPRRPGETWKHGDVGGAATYVRQSSAAAALVGKSMASQDEGLSFTLDTINFTV